MRLSSQLVGGHGAFGRATNSQISIRSTTLPLAAVVGIAIGAALVLFIILVSIAIILVKRKHRLETKRISKIKEMGLSDMDLRAAIRSTRPPEICLSRRLSFDPILPVDGNSAHDWTSQDLSESRTMAKENRLSNYKDFFRMSGARNSWPLFSNISLSFLPSKSPITPSPVAPPGYILEDPRWPKRSSSKLSRRRGSISQEQERSQSPLADPYVPLKAPQQIFDLGSTSETQLSMILRSTSQRLKDAHRRSLTRTMSALGQHPGSPPSKRLPTPPLSGKHATESCEALIGQSAESAASSLHDSYHDRSLSPRNDGLGRSFEPVHLSAKSPTPSGESPDSLCRTKTPDLMIPVSLTSPSKHGSRDERRHKMQLSTGSAKDISVVIHNDSRASLEAIGGQNSPTSKTHTIPQRISLARDPFYSAAKSSKLIIPNTQVQGPRPQPPLNIRKATFGQEMTAQRPESFCSPLQDVSGNAQPSRNSKSGLSVRSAETNPFQWSPREAAQTLAAQTSPTSKRTRSRRKGHKRSNVVRMSNLPRDNRPTSIVDVVPEEPDEDSPMNSDIPHPLSIRKLEPVKSTNRSTFPTSGGTLSTRPPSSAIFNPSLRNSDLTSRSEDNSPTLGLEDIRNSTPYSRTLSACNYYAERGGASEEEFFRGRNSTGSMNKPRLNARRHERNYPTELSPFPTHQSQQGLQESVLSSTLPSLTNSLTPILTPPSARVLPSIDFSMASVKLQSAATTAPPILTISTPSHLIGPRSQFSKSNYSGNSPSGISVRTSIGMLRRMNSEVSCCSSLSSNSPALPDYYSTSISSYDESEERRRTRGSKNYLSLGNLSPKPDKYGSRQRHMEKRDSHRAYKERREQRNEEMRRDDELTPLKEVNSSPTGAHALGITNLRFPTLSREATNGPTPPRDTTRAEKEDDSLSKSLPRWSDAMTKPTHSVTRRESKMEHPSPQTPPKWGLGCAPLGLAEQRWMGDMDKENKGKDGNNESRDSLGLYDQDGFLRSSPEREATRLERERRDAKRLSGFVM